MHYDIHGGGYKQYDVLLGLDFLIKIGAIMDVEQGLI